MAGVNARTATPPDPRISRRARWLSPARPRPRSHRHTSWICSPAQARRQPGPGLRTACGAKREPRWSLPSSGVVERVARGETDRRPSQKLPPTAIYCHFGAAKPLRPLQPFRSFIALREQCRPASHWLWIIGSRSSFFTEAGGGWGRRPKGDAPRSEASAPGARWLSPARPQPRSHRHTSWICSPAQARRQPGPGLRTACGAKRSLGGICHRAGCRTRRPGRDGSETLPKTATYCHLLPFWSRKTATPIATVSVVHCPSRAMPASLGPGLRTASRAKRSLRGILRPSAVCHTTGESTSTDDCIRDGLWARPTPDQPRAKLRACRTNLNSVGELAIDRMRWRDGFWRQGSL